MDDSSATANKKGNESKNIVGEISKLWSIDENKISEFIEESYSLPKSQFANRFTDFIKTNGTRKNESGTQVEDRLVMSASVNAAGKARELQKKSDEELTKSADKNEQIKAVRNQASKLGASTVDTQDAAHYDRWFNSADAAVKKMEDILEQSHARIEEIIAKLSEMDATEPLFQGNAKSREDIALRDQDTVNTTKDKESAIDNKEQTIKATQDEIIRLREQQKQAKLDAKAHGGQETAVLETFKKNLLTDAQGAGLGSGLPHNLFDEKGLMGLFIKDVAEAVKGGIMIDEEQNLGKKFNELKNNFRKQAGAGNRQKSDGFLNKVADETKNIIETTKAGGKDAFIETQIAELEKKVALLEKENDDIKTGKNKSWLKPVKTPESMKPKKEEKKVTVAIVEEVKAGVDGIKQAVESNSPEMGQIAPAFSELGQAIITSNQSVSSAIASTVTSINDIKKSVAALQAHADRMQTDIMMGQTNLMTFAENVKRRISKIC